MIHGERTNGRVAPGVPPGRPGATPAPGPARRSAVREECAL